MRIPAQKRLALLGRWLRSRGKPRALILGYHRVAEDPQDPYALCVTPRHFAAQLTVLQRQATPVSLSNLIAALRNAEPLPSRAVAITLDDGYYDNLANAKPLLDRFHIPATVFVAAGYLGKRFWWDELAGLLGSVNGRTEEVQQIVAGVGEKISGLRSDHPGFSANPEIAKGQLLQSLYRYLLECPESVREKALAQLRKSVARPTPEGSPARALTAEELVMLTEDSEIEIGAHSLTHPRLARLSRSDQQREIAGSKTRLEALLDRPLRFFSYPNGSFSPTTIELLREAGFEGACSSFQDVAVPGMDLFQLPRFWVPDCDGPAFARWLKKWL